MRLSLSPSLLALITIARYSFGSESPTSNITYFIAPRHQLDGVLPIIAITEAYIRAQTDGSISKAVIPTQEGRCSANNPCADQSCCNSHGFCGFRPEHCHPTSPDTCISNCGAKAPCGESSVDGTSSCPLNLCCSHFGTCGTSEFFCRHQAQTGALVLCQSNCGDISIPSCAGIATASRRVAYYEAWNSRRRSCDKVWPKQIDTTGLTHLILSFATIDPKTFEVRPMHPGDKDIYKQFLALPNSVSKWIGIGGWEFSDPGGTRYTWAEMTSTKDNRQAFIKSLKHFLATWNFGGVDIDWEWPGISARGGSPDDKQNQLSLMTELRQALGNDFGLSTVLPAQYEYLKYMDPKALEAQVDFFNVLTYDLHGPWDASVPGLGPYIKPHTDLKEIDEALNLLWSADVTPNKVNLGVANYGRGYTVSNKSCMKYGCQYTGPSKAGPCTDLEGVLSACEIKRIVAANKLSPRILPGGANVKEISWGEQWVAYDDDETFRFKLELANNRCLGGTALWAIDYEICDASDDIPQTQTSLLPLLSAASTATAIASSVEQASSAPLSFGTSYTRWSSQVGPGAPVASTIRSPAQSTTASSNIASIRPWPTASTASSVEWGSSAAQSTIGSSSQDTSNHSSVPTTALFSHGSLISSASQWSAFQSSSTTLVTGSSTNAPTGSTAEFSAGQSASSSESKFSSSLRSSTAINSSVTSSLASRASSSGSTASNINTSSITRSVVSSSILPSTVVSGSTDETLTPSGTPASSAGLSAQSSIKPSAGSSTSGASDSKGESLTPSSTSTSPAGLSSQSSNKPSAGTSTSGASVTSNSSAPVPTSTNISYYCPEACKTLPWCSSFCYRPIRFNEQPPTECLVLPWCMLWWTQSASMASPSSAFTTSADSVITIPTGISTTKASTGTSTPGSAISSTTTGSATTTTTGSIVTTVSKSTLNGSKTRSAVDSTPGSAVTTMTGNEVNTGSRSPAATTSGRIDSDPICVPNDCVSVCIAWKIITALLFKRPVCPCIPKKCDSEPHPKPSTKPHDIDPEHDSKDKDDHPENGGDGECQMLGCGCGWLGLGFGPGCGDETVSWDLPKFGFPCGLFGCNPCGFFGCNTPGTDPNGILGYNGYCLIDGGCPPCPPEICSGPSCTIPGGCGPKPGPPPTHPANRPKSCEESQKTTVTERFVWCTEGFAVSELPSSIGLTSSTMISSVCVPFMEATLRACPGALLGYTTTTTKTERSTLTTEGSMCTRAPLSLDDDEGDNMPADGSLSSSIIFSSNTSSVVTSTRSRSSTLFSSTRFSSSINPIITTIPIPTIPSRSIMTSSSALSKPTTSFAVGTTITTTNPTPALLPAPMNRFGDWKVEFHHWMQGDLSGIKWVLHDPNGYEAGTGGYEKRGDYQEITDYIESKFRAEAHSMLFGVRVLVTDPRNADKARVRFSIEKDVANCFNGHVKCRPSMTTEDKTEEHAFEVESCYDKCADSKLRPADFWCNDLNDAMWLPENGGWRRTFWCGWKGF